MEKFTKGFDRLTEYEQRVSSYIVRNYRQVANMSINNLAEKSYASKTVIINMAQKLGFSGYTDLRYYIKTRVEKEDKSNDSSHVGDEVLKFAKMTDIIIDINKIKDAARRISSAQTVLVAARGASKARSSGLISLTSFTQNSLSRLSDVNLYVASSSIDTALNDNISRIGFFS